MIYIYSAEYHLVQGQIIGKKDFVTKLSFGKWPALFYNQHLKFWLFTWERLLITVMCEDTQLPISTRLTKCYFLPIFLSEKKHIRVFITYGNGNKNHDSRIFHLCQFLEKYFFCNVDLKNKRLSKSKVDEYFNRVSKMFVCYFFFLKLQQKEHLATRFLILISACFEFCDEVFSFIHFVLIFFVFLTFIESF